MACIRQQLKGLLKWVVHAAADNLHDRAPSHWQIMRRWARACRSTDRFGSADFPRRQSVHSGM